MFRLSRNAVVLQLIVIGLIGLLQVAATMGVGQAFKAVTTTGASSQVMEEEIDFDEVLTEETVSLAVEGGATLRWVVEQQPPAPVHLEREGRPPPA